MFVQKRHSGEGFGAVFALVFLYVRVGLQMCPQVRPVCKSSVAVRARERLLPWFVGGGVRRQKKKSQSEFLQGTKSSNININSSLSKE